MTQLHHSSELSTRVINAFQEYFSHTPEICVHAPGRVNLIGEHTDYNEGFVLPCALQYGTAIAARPRQDDRIHVIALDYDGAHVQFDSTLPIEPSKDELWSNYVRGVVHVLRSRDRVVCGVDLMIGGDVPQGAGLSSSASLQVALGLLFSELNDLELSPVEIALYAQQAENDYVGCQCGVMDQLASALGQAQHAVLIDCRSLETQLVSIPEDLRLVIVNSNVRRGLVDSAYNERRRQCEEAAELLNLSSLRDASLTLLEDNRDQMSEVVYRRARHVITENQRTLDAVSALQAGDLKRLGALMMASHASLRDDFEVTVSQVDTLVDMMSAVIGEHGGVRMTGGGFGGCVVAVVPSGLTEDLINAVNEHYEARTGLKPSVYLGEVSCGVITLS